MTPLYIACQGGHVPVVQHLIAAKALVDTPLKVDCIQDADRLRPHHHDEARGV